MGTINYKSQDYITLGLKPYDVDDFINDAAWIDDLKEIYDTDSLTDDQIWQAFNNDVFDGYYPSDRENAESIINNYRLYYYDVSIQPGYYEGYYIAIQDNYKIDCYAGKLDALKELTQLKHLLIELAGVGYVSCICGWCMGYADYKGTLRHINRAIKEMKQDVMQLSLRSA